MARGKYAVKAAGQRATAAAETVEALKAQLAEERATAAREIAELKTENQRLAGQLTSAVKTMAAAEVDRVRVECRAEITKERGRQVEKAVAIAAVLDRDGAHLTMGGYADIADALGVSMGDFLSSTATTRASRRATTTTARYVEALKDRGLNLKQIVAGPPGQ